MRGVAALLVTATHVQEMIGRAVIGHGHLMVDLFFLLSGFVLAMAYGETLSKGGRGVWFTRQRLRRLYPMMLIGLALGWLVAITVGHGAADPSATTFKLLLSALFLPWLGGGLVAPLNGPLWSLQLELWINVAYGFTARWLSNLVLWGLVAASASVLIFAVATTGIFDGGFANAKEGLPFGHAQFLVGWARIGFSFPLGILLYRYWAARKARLSRQPISFWVIAAAMLAIATIPAGYSAYVELAIVGLAFPALLMLAANARHPGRVGERMGQMSFPLYVTHAPVLLLAAAFQPSDTAAGKALWFACAAACAIGLAAILSRRTPGRTGLGLRQNVATRLSV